MGTTFTIDVRDDGEWSEAIDSAVAWLHHVDATFSTYRPDSDITRVRRGELTVADADPLVAEVIDLCLRAQRTTGGYFTALLDGQLDPTGLVKGWSIEHASRILREHGCANHAVNGGGDLQLAGTAAPSRPWTVGISDPHDRSRVLTTIAGTDLAVATSGTAERGPHIVNPFTHRAARDLASVTVAGPSLTAADSYATAAFAMGSGQLAWLEALEGYEALVVTAEGTVGWTSGWLSLTRSTLSPAHEIGSRTGP